jgi:dihydroorotate dehydrogenase
MIARLLLPALRLLPAEQAHDLTIRALRLGLAPLSMPKDDPILAVDLWTRRFPNPIGLAAGFDKNAEVADAMLRWGFGFVEIGTVTPLPQAGNPKPRLFRLTEDQAVINRMGFNNRGLPAAVARLQARRRRGIVGGNVGKNRTASDAVADYVQGVRQLAPWVDYLTINVSSPNTPGLRDLQRKSEVSALIEAVQAARDEVRADPATRPPLLLKIAPDLTQQEREDLAAVAISSRIDGLIVSNTTVARPDDLASPVAHEPGGLSGAPLFRASTALLAEMHRLTAGRVPLIGAGGVSSGADAYAKIRAGASLVQFYTALVYHGPGLVGRIKRDLAALLRRDGFASVAAAVGTAEE